jgi:ABC-type branched-subunit amino acid transport system ATPase component
VGLSLGAGDRVALIGPNGAGKSTVMNCVSGLVAPTTGEVRLDGAMIGHMRASKRAGVGVARTFQNLEIFKSMSVIDNVLVALDASGGYLRPRGRGGAGWRRRRALEALALFDIDGLADRPASELPYGVCKLLELSRALVRDPILLLLDEPMAGVSDAKGFLQALIAALDGCKTTVLFVEHDMHSVRTVCERVYVMDSGEVIAHGSYEEIANDPTVRTAYLGTEALA